MSSVLADMSVWRVFLLGGPVMWPILFCSVFALAIVIERLYYFSSVNVNRADLNARIFSALRKNDIKTALMSCDGYRAPVANVLKAGLLKYGMSRDEVTGAMEQASHLEIPELERRLAVLLTVGNISPLLGLLGTVTGMCGLFYTIQLRSAAMNPVTPADVAGGVWEALITTAAGLLVAIPVFVAYNFFVMRVNRCVLQMERAAVDLLDFMVNMNSGVSEKG